MFFVLSVAALMAVTMSLAGVASAQGKSETAPNCEKGTSNAFDKSGNERVLENAVEKCGLVVAPPPPPPPPFDCESLTPDTPIEDIPDECLEF